MLYLGFRLRLVHFVRTFRAVLFVQIFFVRTFVQVLRTRGRKRGLGPGTNPRKPPRAGASGGILGAGDFRTKSSYEK